MKNLAKAFIEGSILLGLFLISYLMVYLLGGPYADPDGYFRAEYRDMIVEIGMMEFSGIIAIHLALGVYLLRALLSRFHPPVNGIIYSVLCFIAFFIALLRAEQFKAIYSLYQFNALSQQQDNITALSEDETALRNFLTEVESIPGKSESAHALYLYSFLIAAFLMLSISFIAYRMKNKKKTQNH